MYCSLALFTGYLSAQVLEEEVDDDADINFEWRNLEK